MRYRIIFLDGDRETGGWHDCPELCVWKNERAVPCVGDQVFVGNKEDSRPQWRYVKEVAWSLPEKGRRLIQVVVTIKRWPPLLDLKGS